MNDFLAFMAALYEDDDEPILLRLIHDKHDQAYPTIEYASSLNSITRLLDVLEQKNKLGYGIFAAINGGRKDEDVRSVKAQFFEADDLPLAEQMKRIREFPLEPSVLVQTRKSIHAYFKTVSGNVGRFTEIQKRLALHFGGDRTISNLSRVMRVPGFMHNKAEPVLVRLLECHPERVYTQDELDEHLPELTVNALQIKNYANTEKKLQKGTEEQMNYLCEHCDFLRHCKEHAEYLSEVDWYHMITVLANFEGGSERIHEYSKHYPRYSAEETDAKIRHFVSSGTNPVTCNTIAEKGFVCPRLGRCSCHSPAGLPYKKSMECSVPEWYEAKGKVVRLMPGVLAHHLADTIPSIYTAESFFLYDSGYYREARDYEIQKIIHDKLLVTKMHPADIKDTMEIWKILASKKSEDVNSDPYIVNVNNGLLNLHTFELGPHTRDSFTTIRVNAQYDVTEDCPQFKKFLAESLDSELVPLVQQMIGYSMTMLTDAQMSFIIKGVACSGKSTLIKILEGIAGKNNVSNIPLQSLGDRFKTSELYGKILNTFSDLPSKAMEDSGVFKAIVGSDSIVAEKKNKPPFSFRPFAKIVYSTNELPPQVDRTNGVFRRLKIISFNKAIPQNRINTRLAEELLEEKNGIFSWGMEGLKRLIANHFHFDDTASSDAEVDRYRISCNSTLAFIQDECIFEQGCTTRSMALYEAYKEYCNRNGLRAMAQNTFSNELESNFKDRIFKQQEPVTRRKTWNGIRICGQTDAAEEEKIVTSAAALMNYGNAVSKGYTHSYQ